LLAPQCFADHYDANFGAKKIVDGGHLVANTFDPLAANLLIIKRCDFCGLRGQAHFAPRPSRRWCPPQNEPVPTLTTFLKGGIYASDRVSSRPLFCIG